MMLGFKRRFAPFVKDGSKTHTIRALGGRHWQPGVICDCYVDPRQKTMALLGRWPCVRVEPIIIYERGDHSVAVELARVQLTLEEKNLLAWRDGFRTFGARRAFDEMVEFWLETHRTVTTKAFDFEGQMIHWDFGKPARHKGRL